MKRFEDLIVWQKSRRLAKTVYQTFNSSKDFAFRDQIQRAAVSVMNNIAEGHEYKTNAQIKHFFHISKASVGEVRSMIYLASDLGYVDNLTRDEILHSCEEIAYILAAIIRKTGQ
jgi:four helix bundle protein